MNRKLAGFLTSLTLIATPFISLVDSPTFAASLHSQQEPLAELQEASVSSNSTLISRTYYRRRVRYRHRRPQVWYRCYWVRRYYSLRKVCYPVR